MPAKKKVPAPPAEDQPEVAVEPEVDSEPVADAELIDEAPEDTGAEPSSDESGDDAAAADEELALAEETFVKAPSETSGRMWHCPVARCKTQYLSVDAINRKNHLARQHGIKPKGQ